MPVTTVKPKLMVSRLLFLSDHSSEPQDIQLNITLWQEKQHIFHNGEAISDLIDYWNS